MEKGGAVYMFTNKLNTTLYIGVTSNLQKRVFEHQNNIFPNSFVSKYNLKKIIYYEGFHSIEEAIGREKQLKGWSRKKKEDLIATMNPKWIDLTNEIMSW
ncbi:GIY-YIG nuclease family protein [Aquiflexum sp.]|uniref:GIY-YIG nuclease family protein n=1 Tax=Aquiflexum sp. TaxID=1872584 RepID=UPI00359422D9